MKLIRKKGQKNRLVAVSKEKGYNENKDRNERKRVLSERK